MRIILETVIVLIINSIILINILILFIKSHYFSVSPFN